MRRLPLVLATLLACAPAFCALVESLVPVARRPRMDYGPFLCYTINCKNFGSKAADNLALKGIAIKLNYHWSACFDTELMRYAAVWQGDFLDLTNTHLTTYKGSREAYLSGTIEFETLPVPGWSTNEVFADPRAIQAGPLPDHWAHFKGLYRSGDRVVLKYSIGTAEVLDSPSIVVTKEARGFIRDFEVSVTDRPLRILLCHGEAAAAVIGGSASVETNEGCVFLNLPAQQATVRLTVALSKQADAARFLLSDARDLKALCKGGPPRWPEMLTTQGKLGISAPYAVDTVAIPFENPWNAWMRLAAFDFLSDGRAAVSTWNGDVWMVSGIDDRLAKISWRRFAAGLHEPLGLKIVADVVHVLGRDGITRLHDLNGDGEADYHENFNNDVALSPSYHAFAMELQTDNAGNFYHVRCGQRIDPALPLNGGVVRVSKDGARAELVATGLRAANGLGVGPRDEIVCADNQGNWIPSSRINLIRTGGFYGYVPHARMAAAPAASDPPLCWLPTTADNSSGGLAWIGSDKWGPLRGNYVHTSYGKGALFLVMPEEVNGEWQGGAVQFPLKFDSGIMRARFHPIDGQLYVCGLKGWQTSGARDGAFQRVRHTGGAVGMPKELHVKHGALEITFADALGMESAKDPENWAVQQWNYKWSEAYGSDDYSVKEPGRKGRDEVAIQSIGISSDGATVSLRLPNLQPVMQMRVQYRIKSRDGQPVSGEMFNTINQVPRIETATPR